MSREDAMWSRGVWLDNAADRARAFPELWRTHQAAKKDGQRSQKGDKWLLRGPIAICPPKHPPAVIEYRRRGASQKAQRAVFDLTVIPDPEAWLTEHLGPLAEYAVLPANTRIDVA